MACVGIGCVLEITVPPIGWIDTSLELATNRRSTYVFLSCIYREEVTPELLRELIKGNALGGQEGVMGTEVLGKYLSKLRGSDLQEAAEKLAVEYAGLFLNAGERPVFPYESVYTSPDGLLMQEARDDVVRDYARKGLQRFKTHGEPEDHIAVELEFMSLLCEEAVHALQAGDAPGYVASLRTQQEFLEKHLLVWCPKFCVDLAGASYSDFYSGVAVLTRSFLRSELDTLSLMSELVQSLPEGHEG
jgi:TorA maturation chaperone TorD